MRMHSKRYGYATNVNYAIPVLIYNKTMVSNPITGYSSLLRTELKGKIAFGDATSSSSAYNHLENMILAMGEGANNDEKVASDAAWEYVEAFLNNLDKIITSSNVTLTGVVNGEYAVGLSWDTKGYEAIKAKLEGDTAYADIEVVYMSEGIVAKNSSVAIIKGTKSWILPRNLSTGCQARRVKTLSVKNWKALTLSFLPQNLPITRNPILR